MTATVELPGGGEVAPHSVTIDYTYDPLREASPKRSGGGYRLTAADYDSGEYFHYTYDAVGNRLTQETQSETNAYTYDIANPVSLRSRDERPPLFCGDARALAFEPRFP